MIGNYFKITKHYRGIGTDELCFIHRSIYEYFVVVYFFESLKDTCELKVCTTKKPENPSVFLTLPVAHELSVLCMI